MKGRERAEHRHMRDPRRVRRRGIHVLVMIAVPASSPIDAELPEQEAAAQSIIEEANVLGGRRVSGHLAVTV